MSHRPLERLPSLNAVRCFEVAGRLQSFTLAAQELHVTQGAVSRMVQVLEQDLGVQLFSRNGRFIALTEAGQAYHREVHEALDRIRTASMRLRGELQGRALSVMVSSAFATRWLVPRLSRFRRAHPQIPIDILSTEADASHAGRAAQVRIRYGVGPWPGFIATRLPVAATLGVVCAPELLERTALRRPADLLDKPLLSYTGETRDQWPEYFESLQLPTPDLRQVSRFYQLLMLAEAAVAGLGFALVPLALVAQELDSGRLVQALPQTLLSRRGYFMLHPQAADHDSRIAAFKQWLLAEAAGHET